MSQESIETTDIRNGENGSERGREAATRARTSENSAVVAMDLSDLTRARESLSRLLVRFLDGGIAEYQLRAATYCFNSIVKAMVHEKAQEIEARPAALEKRLERSR